jgi:hypothetical protein
VAITIYMQELLKYLTENKELDNEVLLKHYEKLGNNPGLYQMMSRNERARDTYVRYELWTCLPENARAHFDQDLNLLSPLEDMPVQEEKEDEGEKGEDTPVQEEKEEEENARDISEAEAKKESELTEQLAALYRQKAKLSNSLGTFADEDNEGRARVLVSINEIEEQSAAINRRLKGDEEIPTTPMNGFEYDWMKTDRELAKMSESEMKVHKTQISVLRSKNVKKVADGKHTEKAQKIIDAIDLYRQRFA